MYAKSKKWYQRVRNNWYRYNQKGHSLMYIQAGSWMELEIWRRKNNSRENYGRKSTKEGNLSVNVDSSPVYSLSEWLGFCWSHSVDSHRIYSLNFLSLSFLNQENTYRIRLVGFYISYGSKLWKSKPFQNHSDWIV